MTLIRITPELAVDDRFIHERFIRASGPGGQNVNKVASAVELRFDVNASSLPDGMKARLVALAGTRIGADGVLTMDSRAFRTQLQNRKAARERLLALLKRAARVPKKRRLTRATAASREARLSAKKRHSATKATRSSVGRRGEE
jgi:ribosome-associated protein